MSPEQLIAAIEAGDIDTVRRLVIDATDAERRACMPFLRDYERDSREQMWGAERPFVWSALHHAKLGCTSDARTAERILRRWWPDEILQSPVSYTHLTLPTSDLV